MNATVQVYTTPAHPGVSRFLEQAAIRRQDEIATMSDRDLRGTILSHQYLALELADDRVSRAVIEHLLEPLVAELERRKHLQLARSRDPLRPAWPKRDASLPQRIAAVKAAMPIERFCADIIGISLVAAGRELVGPCPWPDHISKSGRSFHVSSSKQVFHCFGCQRSGDVITLAMDLLEEDGFMAALEAVERFAGILNRGEV